MLSVVPCCCPSSSPPACPVTIHVNGCAGVGLAGALVSVAGGPSGTTNSSGDVVLDVGTMATHAYTISKTRFATRTVNQFVICGNTFSVSLFAATGYVCVGSLCNDPIPTTLNLGDSAYGGTTIAWNGSYWTGTGTAGYGGSIAPCQVCPGKPGVTLTYIWDPLFNSGLGSETLYVFCPQSGGCPDPLGSGAGAGANETVAEVVVCPPSFSVTITTDVSSPWTGAPASALYNCQSSTFTITE